MDTLVNFEDALLKIIQKLSFTLRSEAAIYSECTQQVQNLISDAVNKINNQIVMDLDDSNNEDQNLHLQNKNVLDLLYKAVNISKLLNKKINTIICAIQIEDIAGQLISSQAKRIAFNNKMLCDLESQIQAFKSVLSADKIEILSAMETIIDEISDNKKANHVTQNDLNEGTTELF